MAKQVEDIVVRLVGEGFEALDKIKGSFRELGKVTNLAEKDILSARDSLLDFAKKAGNTEAVNKGLIEAFKGLRSQTQLCGDAYGELTAEITRLEAVQRGSTAATDRQREALLRNAAAGKQNAAAIEQQIQGLTRLQQQTRPGSSAFLQLGKDIDAARVNLGRFKSEAAAFSSTLTQIPGASLDTLGRQIGRLTQGMQTLKIASDEYLNTQQRINLLGEVRGRQTGRQQVRAANQMYESSQYASFDASRAGNLELPSTLAGIQQRVGEINAELQNVSGYTRRRSLTIELADLNRQLKSSIVDVVTQENLAVDAVRRRVNASRQINQASGFGAFSSQVAGGEFDPAITASIRRARERLERENDRLRAAAAEAIQISRTPLLPAAGQTSAPGTGELISGGARRLRGQVETTFGAGVDAAGNTPRAPWQQNYLPNAAVGTAPGVGFAAGAAQAFDNLGRSTDRARRPLRDIFAELERVKGASNGSVNSLQAQISAWTQIRSAVSSSAPVFATATKQIEALSRQQARLQVGGGRRLTGSQLAQGTGAAISGGIFGGPEGLIGGLGGLAVGGVGGAFAGAAAGAQAGMFRQQLGGTAEYAASIGKLQIALRGVVGSQQAYDAAIRAAAAATRDLNIPQEEATRGLTRLSAAVIGAGGTVADSSFAFRAMSEAIKATGGNAEQVDGALLALTQVFSKGKVSAEELNQIAERLPGTFTLFAQAAGKTGPELQKALEQGQVGLNDLMKFLDLTSKRYGTTALEIAGSSQDAGARLTVAFQAMRLEVGKALQPLGAELQETFTAFIKDITPAVVGSAKAIAAVLSFFTDNKAAAGLATFAIQASAVALAIKGLQAAFAGVVAMNLASVFTGVASKVVITGSGAAAATPQVITFGAALKGLYGVAKSLLALGVITVTIDVIVNNFKRLATLKEEIAKFRGENVVGPAGPTPDVQRASYRFAGASRETVTAAQKKQQEYVAKLRKDLKDLEVRANAAAAVSAIGGQGKQTSNVLSDERTLTALRIKRAEEVLNLNLKTFKTEAEIEKARQDALSKKFASPAGDQGNEAREKRGASLLQAIEQREEALLNLRTQREEQLAQIREQAAEQAKQIETQLADKRLAIERQIQDIQRQGSDFTEDSERRIRAASGESPDRIADEQKIADIFREERDAKLDSERRLADDKQEQERTIAEFQRGVAKSINEANRAHTKSMGEIQKQYATSVAKIIDEGTGKAGKRLQEAAQLAAAYIQRGTANSQIATVTSGVIPERRQGVYDFRQVGGTGATTPAKLLNTPGFEDVQGPLKTIIKLDDTIERLRKALDLSRTPARTPGIGDQFTALLGAEGFDTAKIATDFGTIASASFIGGLLAQNSRIPESQILRDSQGRPLNGSQPTAYPIPVIPSSAPTAQRRNDQAQEEQGTARAKTAQQIKEAFAGVNAESAQFTNSLNEQLGLLGSQRKFLDMGFSDALSNDLANLDKALAASKVRLSDIAADLKSRGSDPATVDAQERAAIARAQELYAINVKLTQELEKQTEALRLRQDDRIGLGMQEGAKAYVESVGTMREATAQLTQTGIKGVEDALFSLVTTGTANFREFAAEILKQSARMILQLTIQRVIMQILGAIGGGGAPLGFGGAKDPLGASGAFWKNANGNAFATNNIVPYAMGGAFTNSIVTKPTLFKFANGGTTRTGLMGEAGPEAIMPLSRGPNGKLGVASSGSGTTNVTVNVDASGSKAQGDSTKSEQLGRVVSQAVQAELIKQRRPGGLLA